MVLGATLPHHNHTGTGPFHRCNHTRPAPFYVHGLAGGGELSCFSSLTEKNEKKSHTSCRAVTRIVERPSLLYIRTSMPIYGGNSPVPAHIWDPPMPYNPQLAYGLMNHDYAFFFRQAGPTHGQVPNTYN